MNILVANSRGGGMRELIPKHIIEKVDFWPGAKLNQISCMAIKNIISHRLGEDTHVYILGGIPDIMQKLKDNKYEEVIFTESEEHTISRITAEIDSISSKIKSVGAIPIFCTICTINIEKWNTARLHQIKTKQLKYTYQYNYMQQTLNSTIDTINKHIINTNKSNNMHTPLTHKTIKHAKGNGKYTYKYNLLNDGVHANEEAKMDWAKTIIHAVSLNRMSDMEEEQEPKREWKAERHKAMTEKPNYFTI